MPNICNAPGCSNDRRYRNRLIVMPHVLELKFHKPCPGEYKKWESKLERVGYSVGVNTRICSNHFRYGKPLGSSRTPCMYMRKYPDWAVPRMEAVRKAAAASDGVICEILAHMLQYIHPTLAVSLGQTYLSLTLEKDNAVHCLCQHVLQQSAEQARKVLPNLAVHVFPGKILEALAIFQHGIAFKNVKMLSPLGKQKVKPPPAAAGSSCQSVACTAYSLSDIHNYALSSGTVCDIPITHSSECASKRTLLDNKCKKVSCQKTVKDQQDKIVKLCDRVSELESENNALRNSVGDLQKELDKSRDKVKEYEKKQKHQNVTVNK